MAKRLRLTFEHHEATLQFSRQHTIENPDVVIGLKSNQRSSNEGL